MLIAGALSLSAQSKIDYNGQTRLLEYKMQKQLVKSGQLDVKSVSEDEKMLVLVDLEEGDKQLKRIESIIYSMTIKERQNPDILNPSRKRRIAKGAGVDISEVNRLVKQFEQTKKMMKQLPGLMGGRGGKKGRMRFPF